MTVAFLLGCGAAGTLGEHCVQEGGWFNPRYHCNPGLACNTGFTPPICETPNAQLEGGLCGSDVNCLPELWCWNTCRRALESGEPCPAGVGCRDGLTCVKEADGPVCR